MNQTMSIYRTSKNGHEGWTLRWPIYCPMSDITTWRYKEFDTYYNAEHEARLLSEDEKYTGDFTRTYDKFGNETFRTDNVEYIICPPSPHAVEVEREVERENRRREFARKNAFFLFRWLYKKPDLVNCSKPVTKVFTSDNRCIFEGKDWGEAVAFIKKIVKTKHKYDLNESGDVIRD